MVENLQKIDLKKPAEDKSEIIKAKLETAEKPKKKKAVKVLALVFLGLFLLTVIIFILAGFLALPLITRLKATYGVSQEFYQALKDQDLVKAEEKVGQTKDSLTSAYASYKRLGWTKFIPGIGIYYKDGDHAFLAAQAGVDTAQILIKAITPYADVLGFKGEGSFTGGTAEDRIAKIIETLGEIAPKLNEVEDKLKIVDENLAEINPNHYPASFRGRQVRSQIVDLKEKAGAAAKTIIDAKPALEILPKVLGHPEPQLYLLIMQNDGELRPTGGFMTAYAIIKLDKGKVIAEKSDDIYSLDEKNKNKVKAPDAIKKYLFSADLKTGLVPWWYLRDMNLSPDFKVSMDTFKKYYDEVPGEPEVDGIIAIDTKVLKDFLTILGPVEVPDYQTFTMDKDPRCHDIPQVVCEIEHIVDTPIPGIKKGRKDVLGPLMKAILSKTFDSPSSIWPGLFRLGMEEINQKHVLFYFDDEKSQLAVEKLNAAGRIQVFEGDYLHINDTNFGGAKSNLFVNHEVSQEIEVDGDDTITKTLTLTYTNPEPMDDCNLERPTGLCLNGILRNFLRVYVPKASQLVEAVGLEEEVMTYDELDKTVFEGFFKLRGDGGKAKVIISYKLPFKYDSGKPYEFLIQKQPGTVGHHYIVSFGDKTQEFDLTADNKLEL